MFSAFEERSLCWSLCGLNKKTTTVLKGNEWPLYICTLCMLFFLIHTLLVPGLALDLLLPLLVVEQLGPELSLFVMRRALCELNESQSVLCGLELPPTTFCSVQCRVQYHRMSWRRRFCNFKVSSSVSHEVRLASSITANELLNCMPVSGVKISKRSSI